uniref:Cyclin-dependent kinase inhibitor domain-containing protein n=1 Tax=Globodera rostochiensis TaxID=31243 RepID=A0A914HL62_GLORO
MTDHQQDTNKRRTRRSLFGSGRPNDTDEWLRNLENNAMEEKVRQWNFDFRRGRPLKKAGVDSPSSSHVYEAVDEREVPEFYRPDVAPEAASEAVRIPEDRADFLGKGRVCGVVQSAQEQTVAEGEFDGEHAAEEKEEILLPLSASTKFDAYDKQLKAFVHPPLNIQSGWCEERGTGAENNSIVVKIRNQNKTLHAFLPSGKRAVIAKRLNSKSLPSACFPPTTNFF